MRPGTIFRGISLFQPPAPPFPIRPPGGGFGDLGVFSRSARPWPLEAHWPQGGGCGDLGVFLRSSLRPLVPGLI